MKNSSAPFRRARPAVILTVVIAVLLTGTATVGASEDSAILETERLIDGIIAAEAERSGAASAQEWLDGALTDGAGMTSEWFVLALRQYRPGLDFSAYADALEARLGSGESLGAAESRRCALLLIACGRGGSPIAVGTNGVMSLIFDLHLASNGAVSERQSAADICCALLSLRLADGGWALSGEISDVDVTAMTVQALAPFYGSDPAVRSAVDSALDLLGGRQLESGVYRSFGAENPESAAQVITALASIGLDPAADPRFYKNGVGLLDGMLSFRLADGGFCHTVGGEYNATATAQALYSLVALWRMRSGYSPLYIFNAEDMSAPPDTEIASCAETVPQASEESAADARTEDTPQKKYGYKPWACLAVIAAASAACALLFFVGKGNRKNFIFIGIVAAALLCVLLFTDIKSPDDYYGSQRTEASGSSLTVTLTIRCDTAVGKVSSDHIPQDGVILPVTSFAMCEGDSVYDLLVAAAREYGLHLESNAARYIEGINYLYEHDCGELSGWEYRVNGACPPVGCDSYRLCDGDSVEWLYTCELGADLE